MADAPQSYAHHTRWDPPFHFFIAPVFLIAFIASIVHFVMSLIHHHHPVFFFSLVILSLAALMAVFKIRINSLKVQDRVIRLEERLRMATLLPEALRPRIPELTERQLVALRFASDGELPALVQRTLTEKLSQDDIKKSIQNWRADNWRV
ncbi:MAG: DUF6526 family protein [Terriglobales bacterium]|jgi:hypothetical protein